VTVNRSTIIRSVIGVVVLAAVTAYLINSIDLVYVWQIVERSQWSILAMTIPVILTSHLVRAFRWQRLLGHLPVNIPTSRAFNAIMVGYAANTIVPRSGELLRPLTLSRGTNVTFSVALSSVVVERVLDILALILNLMLLLVIDPTLLTRVVPSADPALALTSLLIPLSLLLTCILTLTFSNIGFVLVERVVRPLTGKGADRLAVVVKDLRSGAGALTQGRQWPTIIVQSVVIWFLWCLPLWMILQAMPWSGGGVSLFDAAVLLTIISVGVVIAPTPGALGVYQGFAQAALVQLYGATSAEGLAFGVIAWVLNYGSALVVGGASMLIELRQRP